MFFFFIRRYVFVVKEIHLFVKAGNMWKGWKAFFSGTQETKYLNTLSIEMRVSFLKRYCQHKIYINLNAFEWFLVKTIELISEIRVIQKKICVFAIVVFWIELLSVRRNRRCSTRMNRFSRNATFVWLRVYSIKKERITSRLENLFLFVKNNTNSYVWCFKLFSRRVQKYDFV